MTSGSRQRSACRLKSSFDCATEFLAVNRCRCVDVRQLDELMAGLQQIQTKQNHQKTDGRFAFGKCKKLRAEISKTALCFSQVSHRLIIRADLPRTDRQLPRSRQRDASKEKYPLESCAPKANYLSYRGAEQFNSDLSEEGGGTNRNQVDVPLHAAPLPNLHAAIATCSAINLNRPLRTSPNGSSLLTLCGCS